MWILIRKIMVSITREDGEVSNELLSGITDNLKFFIENITCVRETFGFSQTTLSTQLNKTHKELTEFINHNNISENEDEIVIPNTKRKSFHNLERSVRRAEQAFNLIPPSYLVSLVSLFDSFYAGLVRCIYNLCPEKLQESDMSFKYRDLKDLDSVREVKQIIVENKIESLLRDSHEEQFKWLASAIGVSTLMQFQGWSEFIEITERRNLFVHANGKVSAQYINICKKHKALDCNISIGSTLKVSKEYFENAFKNLYKISIMLSYMLSCNVYLAKFTDDQNSVDKHLISRIFELISDELYDVAIDVSIFALGVKFKHSIYDKCFFTLNLAQAYKWADNQEKCIEVLRNEDCSAWRDEFLLPKYVLEDDYESAYNLMAKVGDNNGVLTATAYRDWPIFKEIRKETKFSDLFHEIFGEQLRENVNVGNEKMINEENVANKEVQ